MTKIRGEGDRRRAGRAAPPEATQLVAVPSLGEILEDASLVERLPRHTTILYRRALAHLAADLEAHAALLDGAAVVDVPQTDGPALLDEAARLLGMKRRTLERKSTWRRLGGYKDVDGHVKFPRTELARHVARRGR